MSTQQNRCDMQIRCSSMILCGKMAKNSTTFHFNTITNAAQFYCRIVKSYKFPITRIINVYSFLSFLQLVWFYVTPILLREKRLPYFMHVPFGIDQSTVGFVCAYLYQFGNLIYAGGINTSVNMFLFTMFVCLTYFLSLLNSRVKCLGYPSGMSEDWTKTPNSKNSFYIEICSIVEFHLKIDK